MVELKKIRIKQVRKLSHNNAEFFINPSLYQEKTVIYKAFELGTIIAVENI